MQIGNLNNFCYDRTRMDQGLPYTDKDQFSTQLTEPNFLRYRRRKRVEQERKGGEWAWNHTANVHLATTSLGNEFKFWGITFL